MRSQRQISASEFSTQTEGTVASDSKSSSSATFEAVSKQFLKRQRERRITPESYDREDRIIAVNLEPCFGKKRRVATISQSDVEAYLAWRSREVSAASVRKELYTLRRLLAIAVELKFISANPAQGIKVQRPAKGRLRYLKPEEFRAVRDECPAWLRPIVEFAVATGMRRGKILGLRWRDVDLNSNAANIRGPIADEYGDQSRIVPLSNLAHQVLASLRGELASPTDKVFSNKSATALNVSRAFLRACEVAGVANVSFNDLRHTAATWMAERGVDIQTISSFLGHKNPRIAARYRRLSRLSLESALNIVDEAAVSLGTLSKKKLDPFK